MNNEQLEKIDRDELGNIASTTTGKNVLGRIMADCHLMSSTFHEDSRRHAWIEGKRDAGLDLLRRIDEVLGEGAGLNILKGYYDERRSNERASNKRGNGDREPDFREPTADSPEY